MRSRSQSMSRTLTSSSCPMCTSSDGCEIRPHDMSVMCSKPVDAAEIDERAEVGDVLDHALPHLILLELLHQLLALAGALGLEDHSARDDDVAAALVQLDDLELVLLSEQLIDVGHAAQRDLRARQERVDAHEVHDHAALDLLDQRAFDGLVGLVGDADALPHAHEVGLLLREDDRAFLVLQVLEQNLDLVARLQLGEILELLERDRALGFEPDVEHDHVVANALDRGLDDLAFFDRRHRALVQLAHLLELELVRQIAFVVQLGPAIRERAKLCLLDVALFSLSQHTSGSGAVSSVGVRGGRFELSHIGDQISSHSRIDRLPRQGRGAESHRAAQRRPFDSIRRRRCTPSAEKRCIGNQLN